MPESQTPPVLPLSDEEICPHLGIREDKETCLGYPSNWNICHQARPASTIRLEHQRSVCLLPAHKSCRIFQNEQVAPLPMELRGRRKAIG